VALARGGATQATKRRRVEKMVSAAGVDNDSYVLDTMDWDDWTDGGGSCSKEADKEKP